MRVAGKTQTAGGANSSNMNHIIWWGGAEGTATCDIRRSDRAGEWVTAGWGGRVEDERPRPGLIEGTKAGSAMTSGEKKGGQISMFICVSIFTAS